MSDGIQCRNHRHAPCIGGRLLLRTAATPDLHDCIAVGRATQDTSARSAARRADAERRCISDRLWCARTWHEMYFKKAPARHGRLMRLRRPARASGKGQSRTTLNRVEVYDGRCARAALSRGALKALPPTSTWQQHRVIRQSRNPPWRGLIAAKASSALMRTLPAASSCYDAGPCCPARLRRCCCRRPLVPRGQHGCSGCHRAEPSPLIQILSRKRHRRRYRPRLDAHFCYAAS
jgi:hypothetical protein